jgi:hypothetical protein
MAERVGYANGRGGRVWKCGGGAAAGVLEVKAAALLPLSQHHEHEPCFFLFSTNLLSSYDLIMGLMDLSYYWLCHE